MASSRISTIPYYIATAIFQILTGVLWVGMNTVSSGTASIEYMVASIAAFGLAAVSILYVLFEQDGADISEADIILPLVNLEFPKWLWYFGSFAVIGGRLYFSFVENMNSTGIESIYSYVWIVASFLLFLATIGNGNKYLKNRAIAASNRLKETQQRTKTNLTA